MALERSWLRVLEVAKESRRRLSGRADVMVRLMLVKGTARELMCSKTKVPLLLLIIAELSMMSAPISHLQDRVLTAPRLAGLNWEDGKALEDDIQGAEENIESLGGYGPSICVDAVCLKKRTGQRKGLAFNKGKGREKRLRRVRSRKYNDGEGKHVPRSRLKPSPPE